MGYGCAVTMLRGPRALPQNHVFPIHGEQERPGGECAARRTATTAAVLLLGDPALLLADRLNC